jgi:transcriptional regulator with XRE-family HTH domain
VPNTTLGRRLKTVIQKTGLSQVDFARKYNISQSSLSLWISGKRIPSHTKVMNIIKALKAEGVPFSTDWAFAEDEINFNTDNSLDVIKEISVLKNLYNNFSVFLISEDSMAPRFLSNEYVGGVLVAEPKFPNEQAYIVETIDGFRGVRMLSYNKSEDRYALRPLNSSFTTMNIPKSNLQRCYRIFWHRIT